jgi:ABC-2 type transport system permease protein
MQTATHTVISSVNWLGMWTLYRREVWRYMKVWNQTLIAPVVTTLLFLAILILAMGGETRMVEGVKFDLFLAPGLIMMAIVQNAFANTSSSLMLMKIQGVIIDILMPPLKGTEITISMVMGGVTRGVMVGLVVAVAIWFFVPFQILHWEYALFHIIAASMMLAFLGMLTGIYSQTFDHLAAITNYIITPLSFLSGTFYSIKNLPEVWQVICHFNPFFYMIDGIRYALTGISDGSYHVGIYVMIGCNVVLWLLTQRLVTIGYRIRS